MKIKISGLFILMFSILPTASHANDIIYYAPDGSKISEAEYIERCKKKTEERATLNKYVERSAGYIPGKHKKDTKNYPKNRLRMNDGQGAVSGKRNDSRLGKRKPLYRMSLEEKLEDNEKAIAEIRVKIAKENNRRKKEHLLKKLRSHIRNRDRILQKIDQENKPLEKENKKLKKEMWAMEQARLKRKYESEIPGLKITIDEPEKQINNSAKNRNNKSFSLKKRELPKATKLALLNSTRCTPIQVKVWDDENNVPGCIDKYEYETRIRNFHPEIKLPSEL